MSDNSDKIKTASCPICDKNFPPLEIEGHVNKCIFLNSTVVNEASKRKRSPSPMQPSCSQSQTNKTSSLQSPSRISTTKSPPKKFKTTPSDKYNFSVPLATQMQPKSLNDFVGQNQILGEGSVLRNLLEKDEIPNMILWGPPGCGKTSLSAVIQGICKNNPEKLKFTSLCAATCGVKDVQNIVSEAKLQKRFGRCTVLFMDEIHRFNKKQQDTFLLHVEKGDIILLGATTENPSFYINSALLSRCRVIVLEKLDSANMLKIMEKAARGLGMEVLDNLNRSCEGIGIHREALKWLADISDGDARIALGNLELILRYYKDENRRKIVEVDDVKEQIKKSHMLYDRKGEEHYNTISAMHKSIRGSDDNAALYWTTRMIVSGEDPLFIARRMVRAASEDIGNADPHALPLAIATMQGCQLLGMPECDCLLAQCAIYLARAPKSREADSALAKAKQVIAQCKGTQPPVPMHIRNAPTKLMKELGYGRPKNGETGFMPPELNRVNFFK